MMLSLPFGRLEARWWGTPVTTALVLLHEGLGSVGLWRDFPERLFAATGRPVFAYSRLGYGRSDPAPLPRPLDYMTREAALLPRVLAAAGIERAVLIGHSDGGSIAAAAGDQPGVLGLVLIAPHFVTEASGLAAIAATRAAYAGGDLRARLARHHDHPDNAFLGWADAWLDPEFPCTFDLRPALARITAPTLVIQGGNDPYGTAHQAELAAALIPGGARLVFPAAAHAPHLEAPDATLGAITDFIRTLLPETQDAD
jgi:pimeloyl-ACP methyl ester carboxylesterase